VDVDWGNGTFAAGGANVSISGPVNGVFTVTARHLYGGEDGFTGPVRVRINHEGSTPAPVVAVPLTLTDPPLIAAGTSLSEVRGSCPPLAVATFTDPGGAEPNLFDAGPISSHYTATIHWGDGTANDAGVITYNGAPLDDSLTTPFTVTGDHDYTTNGTYTITVTLHHEGAVPDVTATTKMTVVSVLNHSQGFGDPNSLVIGAALSGSTILVVPSGKQTGALTDSVQVLIDGVPQVNTATGGTTFTGFNTVTIFGQAGNDNLEVAGGVLKNASVFGSGGNDRMKGGAGNNILVGGAGNDQIIGGSGHDILIGGGGNDQLVGGPGGDILIAGSTDFDSPCDPANATKLLAVRNAWTSTASYNTRAAAVLALFSTNGTNAAHIHHTGTTMLTGSSGVDLFFTGSLDKINGKK
jgi:Ca2+-binding RTX toxin-like protein